MSNKGSASIFLAVILAMVMIGAGAWLLQNKNSASPASGSDNGSSTQPTPTLQNDVTITSKVPLAISEIEQLATSVDAFMNEYKLPKGVPNSYTLSIEKRLGNAVEVFVSPGENGDSDHYVIQARKTDNVWQVDPNGGPWCTLEAFEQKTCPDAAQ